MGSDCISSWSLLIFLLSRDFYRYINSQKKDTQGIPPLKRKNGKGVAQSDLEKAEEFNGQFTDVFNKNEHTQVPLLDRSAPFMNDIAVSKDGVIKLLKGLNPSKALGPDALTVMIHWWVRKPSRGPNNCMFWAMIEAEGEVGIP